MTEQAKRIEAQVAESALGHELMQPLPPEWGRSINELTRLKQWAVVMNHRHQASKPYHLRVKMIADATADTLEEAHRLCREQAWQKHRKNTEAPNA